jgi:hypothetical protein
MNKKTIIIISTILLTIVGIALLVLSGTVITGKVGIVVCGLGISCVLAALPILIVELTKSNYSRDEEINSIVKKEVEKSIQLYKHRKDNEVSFTIYHLFVGNDEEYNNLIENKYIEHVDYGYEETTKTMGLTIFLNVDGDSNMISLISDLNYEDKPNLVLLGHKEYDLNNNNEEEILQILKDEIKNYIKA